MLFRSQRNLQFQKQEQEAKNERREYDKQQKKFRQMQQKVEYQQNTISRQNPHGAALLKKTMHRVKAYEARFEKEFENMTELPEYEEAMFTKFGNRISIPNGKIVLDFTLEALRVPVSSDSQEFTTLARNIHLFIQGPEHICITGKNGCGKTTLMRILAKELLQRSDIKAAYMPQNYEELLDMEQTPIAFLSDGSKESISMMRTYLGSMKFTTDEMEHPMRELSGGQKEKSCYFTSTLSAVMCFCSTSQAATFHRYPTLLSDKCLPIFRAQLLAFHMTANILQKSATKYISLQKKDLSFNNYTIAF